LVRELFAGISTSPVDDYGSARCRPSEGKTRPTDTLALLET